VEAYRRALAGDPVAAYGGVIGCNRTVDEATAREIRPLNYDAIIAPDYESAALAILKRKKKGQMVILRAAGAWGPAAATDGHFSLAQLDIKRVSGGLLLQTPDTIADDQITLTPVTKRQPTLEEVTDLIFAFRACKHVKSNCVVIAKHLAVVGSGAGQQSRVLAAEIAVKRAEERARGAVMATEGFFPFADGVDVGIRAGITAVIHPGGSIRDAESIAACDQHGAREASCADLFLQHDGCEQCGDHDARLAHRGHRRGRRTLQRGEHERIGAEGADAREDRRRADRAAHGGGGVALARRSCNGRRPGRHRSGSSPRTAAAPAWQAAIWAFRSARLAAGSRAGQGPEVRTARVSASRKRPSRMIGRASSMTPSSSMVLENGGMEPGCTPPMSAWWPARGDVEGGLGG